MKLSWLVGGILALALALVWVFVWPEDHVTADTGRLRYFLLRWGHSLAWLFLSAMFFLKAAGNKTSESWGSSLGSLGGLSYAAFLVAFLTTGNE